MNSHNNLHNDNTYFGGRNFEGTSFSVIIDGDGTIYMEVGGESILINHGQAVELNAFLKTAKFNDC